MANEVRGILFETIADAALSLALKSAGIKGEIYWNQKPKGLSVTPDFTIGKSPEHLTHVVLVTASGSAKESEKKSWRNLGEMQEVKAQLDSQPIVINLYFKSIVKQGVSAASDYLYDSILHIEKSPYYKSLEQWVEDNLRNGAKGKDERRVLLQDSMKASSALALAIKALAKDLATALKQRKDELDPLWSLMREDYLKSRRFLESRTTNVRRGLGKLMVLEPHVRQLVYDSYKKIRGIPPINLPNYVFDLGFFDRRISGAHLCDDEVKGVIDLLTPQICEELLHRAPSAMSIWINPLRDLGRVATHVDFVQQHYDDFTNPSNLQKLLVKCFHDPAGLSGESGDEKVWVYETMVSLLKAKSEKLQGYGLAQLAVDSSAPEFGAGGFIIPPFVQCEKMLSTDHLISLSKGLAGRFSENVALSDLNKLKGTVLKWVIKENLEDRLIPYRNFEPLLWLLETELKKQDKQFTAKAAITGWVNEYAGIGRASATTPFVQVGNTLIHWKSVSDAGKDHKRKELSARARNVKYQYHPKTKTFTRRNGVDQLALIVDGTFTDADLKILIESGWDIIVYPDQVNELVSRLK